MLFFIRRGQYDFVETIDAPGPESVLGFTIWYSKKGFGNIQTLPAFGDQEIRKIIKKMIKILKYLNRVLRNISDITYADIITPYI